MDSRGKIPRKEDMFKQILDNQQSSAKARKDNEAAQLQREERMEEAREKRHAENLAAQQKATEKSQTSIDGLAAILGLIAKNMNS